MNELGCWLFVVGCWTFVAAASVLLVRWFDSQPKPSRQPSANKRRGRP